MRIPRFTWEVLAASATALAASILAQRLFLASPTPAPATQPRTTLQQDTPPPDRELLSGQPYWADPSIDPKVLERAYAKPEGPLPQAARPTSPAIHPPDREWRRARREDQAVPY
jgi:hypothetical protein